MIMPSGVSLPKCAKLTHIGAARANVTEIPTSQNPMILGFFRKMSGFIEARQKLFLACNGEALSRLERCPSWHPGLFRGNAKAFWAADQASRRVLMATIKKQ
jgi:hypothetical protein